MSLLCALLPESEVCVSMAEAPQWLAPSETGRLQSFGTQARRASFLAGRWLARQTVRQWLGAAALPVLDVAPSGACTVRELEGVHVSISHSAGYVACAVSGMPVGVDVEGLARRRDVLALAEAVHGVAERQRLAGLAAGERVSAFLHAWTMKEAWLKARGRGLDFALMRSLDFQPGADADVAVTLLGPVVMAVAVVPRLPQRIDGPAGAAWQRNRTVLT